ncbi:MAG: hypothetical protein HRT76_05455 [Halieaceae bacterium]|nr:hypothetical protein [Halieaceae bacterium]
MLHLSFIAARSPRLLMLLLALATPLSLADTAVVETAQGATMTYEYEGDSLRLTPDRDNPQNYAILRDGTLYSVSETNGEPTVINVSQAMALLGAAVQQAAPGAANARVESLTKTGRKETVANIEGEVYDITFVDFDGKTQRAQMVLSKDPRALRFRDAVFTFATVVTESMGQEIDQEQLQSQLIAENLGVLRYGDDLSVAVIQEDTINPQRFELPAPPIDMSNLGGLQNMLKGSSDGDGDMGKTFDELLGN